ncbi:MAG: putative RNA methyltransferase [Streptosporangiaceae bacterium]
MLEPHLRFLACPHCLDAPRLDARTLACPRGHTFDVARQGYVSLLAAGGRTVGGDTGSMVAARARFLERGHFAAIADVVADAGAAELARFPGPRCAVELGAGTGYYMSRLAARLDEPIGLVAVDVSTYAMRYIARHHPEAAAVVADVRGRIPVATGAAGLVLDVFAPRNSAEVDRILASGGALVIVTPEPDHLAEVAGPLGLLRVDPDKRRRLVASLPPGMRLAGETPVRFGLRLTHDDARDLARMGPAAWHQTIEETDARVRALPDPTVVTASVHVLVYRRGSREEPQS